MGKMFEDLKEGLKDAIIDVNSHKNLKRNKVENPPRVKNMMPHKTLEERLETFYNKPIADIEPIIEQEISSGFAVGDEI